MGTYQGKALKNEGVENIVITSPSDQAPPVFGSPLDTESYLASIANKVGVPILGESPRSTDTETPEPPLKPVEDTNSSGEQLLEDNHVSDKHEKQVIEQEDIGDKMIPVVFHWDHGGTEVYVCGSFSNWEKIPMNKSRSNFTTIIELPEGRHEYKFFVDGEWLHDIGEECQDNGLGTLNNVVTVTQKDFDIFNEVIDLSSLQKGKGSVSPPGSYGQLIPSRSATTGLPPYLPPLLQQTVLNQETPSDEHPTLLPEPNHVILNHLYALSIKDGVLVMGTTNRYREKYITTLMYKPVHV